MKFASYSVYKPVTVTMAVLSVLVLGYISLQRLPLELMPEFSSTRASVNVDYPSSSPTEVERDITRPLEEVLSTLENLETMSSTSSSGGSNISLEFKAGSNMDLVSLEIRDRLDQVKNRLPDEVERTTIRRHQSGDRPIFSFSIGWQGARKELFNFVEEVVRPRLERVPGVANVESRGIQAKQVIIELDPARLDAHGVDLSALSQSLRNNNVNLSGGYVIEGGKKFTLRTVGEFENAQEIEDFPLLGGKIKLGDLGVVRFDFPEKRSFSRLNGEESITIQVFKASTANVVSVCQDVAAALAKLEAEPRYADILSIQTFSDQSQQILQSINDLTRAGIFGGALAAVVLFLFLLKVRSTLIISLAIPVSVIFTFGMMYLLNVFFKAGITINIVSLMGLMVAIGMLVDSSVVVLENIFRHKQDKGQSPFEAAVKGSGEVGVAVLASTATTVAVFASFIFVNDSYSSRYMRDFGLTVGIALIAALVVAVTLVPMISARLLTGKERQKQKSLIWMMDLYGGIMSWLLRWRFVTLIMMAVIGGLSYYLFTHIDRGFMPRVAARQVSLSVLMERSYTLEQMAQVFNRLEGILLDKKEELEIASVSSEFSNRNSRRGQYRSSLNIYLSETGNTTDVAIMTEKIKAELPVIPGVEYTVGRRHGYGGGADQGTEVRLRGDDPGLLELYGDIIKARLLQVPSLKDVQTTLETGDDEIHLQVDRKKTEQYGITSQMVARTISTALGTRATTRIKSDQGEVDVILQLRGGNEISLQEVQNITFENRQGEMIPLHAVVEHTYEKGPLSIRREDRRATLSIIANTDAAGMMFISEDVEAALADLRLPNGYSWEMGRNFRMFRSSESASNFSLIMAVVLMYIIMAALFESFVHPFTILFTVPFSIIGVAVMFKITGTALDQMANLGILVLFGLVVNNGIILIDHINNLRKEGMERSDAIIQAGKDRFRPILMTAFTSLFGLLPLTLPFLMPEYFPAAQGRGRMWAPVSLAVFGGLTTSTFLTLIILPSVYSYMDDVSRFFVWLIGWVSSKFSRQPVEPMKTAES